MIWAINENGVNAGEVFDDGVFEVGPGDEGFTREHIDAHLEELGPEFTADFQGKSWPPAEEEPAE